MRFRDILLAAIIIVIGINITAAHRDGFTGWQKFVANIEGLVRQFEYGSLSTRRPFISNRSFSSDNWHRVDSISNNYPGLDIKQIVVESRNGDVRIIGHNSFAITVDAVRWAQGADYAAASQKAAQTSVDIQKVNDTLVIKAVAPSHLQSDTSIDFNIYAPSVPVVSVTSTSGNIYIEDMYSGAAAASTSGNIIIYGGAYAKAASTSGDITAAGVQGPAQLESTSGNIIFYDNRGKTTARTTSGDIDMRDMWGSIDAASISGNLSLNSYNNADNIALSTTSGNIEAFLENSENPEWGDPFDKSFSAISVSGDVLLQIPTDASAAVELRSLSGNISCDLPLQNKLAKRGRLQGSLGPAQGSISVNTTSGNISAKALPGPEDDEDYDD